jgi:hypothetical protein
MRCRCGHVIVFRDPVEQWVNASGYHCELYKTWCPFCGRSRETSCTSGTPKDDKKDYKVKNS